MVVSSALSVFFLSVLLFSWNEKIARRIAVLGISLLGVYEAALGISQILGFSPSGHTLFALTGTLSNPGPYGGLMAVVLSVAFVQFLKEKAPYSYVPLTAAVAAILVLPASMSRAGWLGAGVAIGIWALRQKSIREWLKVHRIATAGLAFLAAAFLVMSFLLKPESALGRLHIWHMDLLAIARKPLLGWGPGKRAFAFGEAQAECFSSAPRSQTAISLSCCPEESFNEYLSLGVELGIPALILILAILFLALHRLLKRKSPLAYGLVAWMVFAFFSYPLSIMPMVVLLAIFLGAAFSPEGTGSRIVMASSVIALLLSAGIFIIQMDKYRQHQEAVDSYASSRMYLRDGTYDLAVECLEPLLDDLGSEFRYLYDYGYALHKTGRYEESNSVLRRGSSISCDPMFHDIMGKNHEALGNYEMAEKEYLHARDMVPCRLYPYILLMDMKASQADTLSAIEYARAAAALPVNPRHAGMQELRDRALSFLEHD
ncbi:MAG: O-antigen ligase family protein [Candidatus Cryptobacteroides sp.]